LKQIEEMEVPIMQQAIGAYRSVTATEEFQTLERMRSDARRNEASALANARRAAVEENDAKWQGVVAENQAALAEKDTAIAETDAKWQGVVAEKDATLAEKDVEIARLRAMLGESK
jgi:hypothetical protein